jgi:hypothetical protein
MRKRSSLHSRPSLLEWAGVLIIGAQIIGVARMQFADDRFFAWSPHDQRTDFTVTATRNGVPVSADAIAARYGLPVIDWHAAGNVSRTIEVAERRTEPVQRWHVRLVRSINAGPRTALLISFALRSDEDRTGASGSAEP